MMLFTAWQAQGIEKAGSALPDYREYRDHNQTLAGLGGFFYNDFNLSIANQTPEQVQGSLVTANLFPILRVAPALGQNFLADDQKWGQNHVALLSYGLWQRLGGSLIANPAKLIAAGWRPAVDTREGLAAMMRPGEPRSTTA